VQERRNRHPRTAIRVGKFRSQAKPCRPRDESLRFRACGFAARPAEHQDAQPCLVTICLHEGLPTEGGMFKLVSIRPIALGPFV
jgi:hypothetical protein